MDIYLAGCNGRRDLVALALTGNIQEYVRGGQLNIYLAGNSNNLYYLISNMKKCTHGGGQVDLYLSGTGAWKYASDGSNLLTPSGAKQFCLLESFYYVNADNILIPLIPHFKSFMLDSGAFSFMSGTGGKPNFDDWLERYIAFIKKHNIDLFFELDVDSVVGYKKVKEYRKKLEKETGKQCIPVWHKSRGKNEFLKMCDEYPYVAIGGIVSKEITSKEYKYFPWFIDEAHKRNAKIHGLGFTNLEGLKKYHFDSVDSSSWTTGNRFGAIYKFTGKTIAKIDKPPNSKVKTRETAVNNFIEWVKFAQWADTHL